MKPGNIPSLRIEVDGPIDPTVLPAAIRARLAGRSIGVGFTEDAVGRAVSDVTAKVGGHHTGRDR